MALTSLFNSAPTNTPNGAQTTNQYGNYPDVRYQLFFGTWAVSAIFHMATNRTFENNFSYFMLTVAAVFLLVKPGSLLRTLIFISIQLYASFKVLPNISNHWIFFSLVNLTIVQAFFYLAIKRKSFSIERNELLETFAPVVKIELLILYFYVVFHKLNSGFFSIAASCATDFYMAQNAYSLLPNSEGILLANAFFTVGIEALIPLLLCFRRTRNIGILIGLAFHCVIAYNPLNGFYDFSSMVFALYILFTGRRFSREVITVLISANNKLAGFKRQFLPFRFSNFVAITALFICGLFLLHFATKYVDDYFRHILWTAYSFAFITVFCISLIKKGFRVKTPGHMFSLPHPSFLLFPIVVFVNGLCPYLGLKTEHSFAMFSNLRTEGGITNHYIVPVSTQIFNYQKDLVEIVSSSDPTLQKLAKGDRLYVFHYFKNAVQNLKPESVEYIRNGKPSTFRYKEASRQDDLLTPIPLYAKFFRFRPVSKNESQPCFH